MPLPRFADASARTVLPRWNRGVMREASVDAALHPAEVDFLYFVSRNDGTNAFTRTLAEHNRMVNRYQRSR